MLELDRIYLGTATSLFAKLDNESIDLICTSPPYGIGMSYESARSWDSYSNWVSQWLPETFRVLKPHGSFFLNVGHMTIGTSQKIPLTFLYYELRPMPMIQEIVWAFPSGRDTSPNRFSIRSERWMWFAKAPGSHYFNLDAIRVGEKYPRNPRYNALGANPTDVWYFDQVSHNSPEKFRSVEGEHPCQYPRNMIRRIVKACCPAIGTTLDPFAGSGTTLYVAKTLGRRYIGFELFPRFVKMATRRLEESLEWTRI